MRGAHSRYAEHFGVVMTESPYPRGSGLVPGSLREAGVTVEPHPEAYPNGRFAELEDPEGNRIQLWEPNAASIARDSGSPGRRRFAGPAPRG